jgi:hypothetical protein
MASAQDGKDREHIAKLVRLMGSEHEGEATTALRKLQGALKQRGLNFNDLGQWIVQPPPASSRTGAADHTACVRRAHDLTQQNQQLTLRLREAQTRAEAAEAAMKKAEARATQLAKDLGEAGRFRQGHWWGHLFAGALVCVMIVALANNRPAPGIAPSHVATASPTPAPSLVASPSATRTPLKPASPPDGAFLPRGREVGGRTAYLYAQPGHEETADILLMPHTPVEVLTGDVVPGWIRVHVQTEQGDRVGYVQAGRIAARRAETPG